MELLEQETSYVASFKLRGLPPEEARKILAANSLSGKDEEWEKLIQLYRGNPLALNTVVSTIKDFFNHSVSEFLTWNAVLVAEPLQAKLIEQLNRLDVSEMEIIGYLARKRTPVLREELRNNIQLGSDSKLISTLKSLERRSMIEKITERSQTFFTISPVVMNVTRENYKIELPYSTSRLLPTSSSYLITNKLSIG
jgi:hypothetical protein